MNDTENKSYPVVGITANRLLHDNVHRDWIRRRYIESIERYSRVQCVILPTIDKSESVEGALLRYESLISKLDGLVLTGDESNLDPEILSGNIWVSDVEDDVIPLKRDRPRDRLSYASLRIAKKYDIPILGICRGLQEINVFAGGKLHEDLSRLDSPVRHSEISHIPRDQQYLPVHEVSIAESGVLASKLEAKKILTNSLHGQGISEIGTQARVEAICEDGIIEAISFIDTSIFQVGVQWHPEWHAATDVISKKLFAAFGEACESHRSRSITK